MNFNIFSVLNVYRLWYKLEVKFTSNNFNSPKLIINLQSNERAADRTKIPAKKKK